MNPEKVTERFIQRRLFGHCFYKKHIPFFFPNMTLGKWEADVLTVSKAHYSTEWEIKISLMDLKRDKKKRNKHQVYECCGNAQVFIPNYFNYVVHGIDPDKCLEFIPEYAGLVVFTRKKGFTQVRKPRKLHKQKIADKHLINAGRLIAIRYNYHYLEES